MRHGPVALRRLHKLRPLRAAGGRRPPTRLRSFVRDRDDRVAMCGEAVARIHGAIPEIDLTEIRNRASGT